MKRVEKIAVVVAVLLLAGVLFYRTCLRRSEFVILSTNDMHAKLDNFPRFATAIDRCRDTVFTIVVDAGDRWTGNAYVDLAENRLPIIKLMNEVGYDVATLGNHDFDAGISTLGVSISEAKFPIVCANLTTEDPRLAKLGSSLRITTPDNITIDFTGVVTNFANGRPDGNDENFVGMTFEYAPDVAKREGARMDGDVKVLLSHMGDDRDRALASESDHYDLIVSGHTHALLDTIVGRTVIGQTERRLKYVGATRVKMRGHRVASIEYENIPLSGYEPKPSIDSLINIIESNPALKVVVGSFAKPLDKVGMANFRTRVIKEATNADIGIYHRGGIRLDKLEGAITLKMLFDNEPFFSQVHTALMTPEALGKLIVTKYNDTRNAKESHRVDLFCTEPYRIIVDEQNNAYDVVFPTLRKSRKYRVAIADYVARNYNNFEAEEEVRTPLRVMELERNYLMKNSPLRISNSPKQRIVERKRKSED